MAKEILAAPGKVRSCPAGNRRCKNTAARIPFPCRQLYFRICLLYTSSDTPILFLTGRDTSMDELYALTIGGDDYITKPYNVPILLARIKLLLKRGKRGEQAELPEYKGMRLSLAAGTLSFGGREAELTKTELKLMYYLFTHAGEIVPRLDLVEFLWDSQIHIDDNTLSVNTVSYTHLSGGVPAVQYE